MLSSQGCIGRRGRCPTVRAGIIPATSVELAGLAILPPQTIISLPVQTGSVPVSGIGALVGAGSYPAIRARIVSAAGTQVETSPPTPDDHFTAGPYGRVRISCGRRVSDGGVRPSICDRIVCAACIQRTDIIRGAAPDNHFAAGPDCRVKVSALRVRWRCSSLSNYPCWDCICRLYSSAVAPPQTIISLPVQTAV